MRPNITLLTFVATACAPLAQLRAQPCEIHEAAKLTASDAGEGDEFGFSVAIDGVVAIVGAIRAGP